MRIRVVFLQDVPPRHWAGDVKEVAGGYARNYLIPQGLAAPAVSDSLKRIAKIKQAAEVRRGRETQDMEVLAQIVNGTTVTLKARAAEGGRLYGSVTSTQIAEELSRTLDREVERRLIHLAEPIKEAGTFEVSVRLYPNITPTITVVVEAEGQLPPPPAPAEALEAQESAAEAPAAEASEQGEAEAPRAEEDSPAPEARTAEEGSAEAEAPTAEEDSPALEARTAEEDSAEAEAPTAEEDSAEPEAPEASADDEAEETDVRGEAPTP